MGAGPSSSFTWNSDGQKIFVGGELVATLTWNDDTKAAEYFAKVLPAPFYTKVGPAEEDISQDLPTVKKFFSNGLLSGHTPSARKKSSTTFQMFADSAAPDWYRFIRLVVKMNEYLNDHNHATLEFSRILVVMIDGQTFVHFDSERKKPSARVNIEVCLDGHPHGMEFSDESHARCLPTAGLTILVMEPGAECTFSHLRKRSQV
jgi:hypothetical protein